MATFLKDPNAVLDWTIDWSRWLRREEVISTSTWTTSLTTASDSNTPSTTSVFLSGGTAGTNYSVANRITTNQGRTEDRTFTVSVQER